MCAKWNSNYDPHLLAERIEAICTRGTDGKVSFGMPWQGYESVLLSSMALSDDLPPSHGDTVVWKGVVAAARCGEITADSLKREISRAENAYLQLPKVRFVVVSNISLPLSFYLRRRVGTRSTITIGGSGYAKFDRSSLAQAARNLLEFDPPTTHSVVRVSLVARSASEAAIKALKDFDLVRGIWNLGINRHTWLRSSLGKRKPVNELLSGPLHTIHKPTGELATQAFYYEASARPRSACASSQIFSRALKFETGAWKALRNSGYRIDLEKAIIRYGRALDDTDFNTAFLRLWSVLEWLTQTATANTSYDQTIKRCSFIYSDRPFRKLLLEHLRAYRNRHVHQGSESSQIETLVYQLKECVEDMLVFHLGNHKWFRSLEEVARFMDLPTCKTELAERQKSLSRALKFQGHC